LDSDSNVIIDELFKQYLSSFPNLNRALKTVAGSVSLAAHQKSKETKGAGSPSIPFDDWKEGKRDSDEGRSL
jgi:hypothetical protein